MLSKTHEIEKQLDSLIRDTKATDSCLHSVFNDFLMLSNTQFIENRVYDEEVEESGPKADVSVKQPEQEKTREQKEAELIPKMQEAVTYGLKVLDSAFEHLDIKAGNSDSEDEEVPDRVDAILEPKDLYVDRPLPYLIGSQAFMEQDDVGLGDLSSDEMSMDSDRDSVSESEDGKTAAHSDEDYNQDDEETPEIIKKKSSMLSYDDDEDEDEDSDIFGDSDKEEENTKSTQQASFADELAARIKGEAVSKAEADRASLSSKKKSKSRKESKPAKPLADDDSDDMFKPPKMEDEDEEEDDDLSPFGGRSGLFSGGRGLFDDDDEGDLFSDAPKPTVAEEKIHHNAKTTLPSTDSTKSGKKIPTGGVSIFPENSLFCSPTDPEPVQIKENGTPAVKAALTGRGLFDEEEEDDFFTGNAVKTSESAKEKPKPKKALDLFEDEDEDGDLFSDKSSTSQSKKEVEEPQVKPPEKKMPAGAVSLFGPETKSLLSEGLKKHLSSTSEEPQKAEQNGMVPEVEKPAPQPAQKPQSRGLFSDDEDTQNGIAPEVEKSSAKPPVKSESGGLFSDDEDAQILPSVPKSQSKPETLSQTKTKKPALSLFDDEEEEDLFASATKSKPKAHQAKVSTPQSSKATPSSLFSDDEDQWLGSKSTEKSETKSGMTWSVSAPSSLPSVKAPQKSSLFDQEDDDLFAPPKESSQKKSQRVALLFEDEDEDDKGALFSIKPAASPAAKTSPAPSKSPPPAHQDTPDVPSATTAEEKPPDLSKAVEKTLVPVPPSPPETSAARKKPAGAVSLFGGIDVFASTQRRSSPVDTDKDDDDGPPLNVKKEERQEEKQEEKPKAKAVSLFDNDEEDEPDLNDSIFTPSKPAKNIPKTTEERPPTKSTGVFQDEELLFSHTQQKDNDPDVDLFSGKTTLTTSSKPSSTVTVTPAAPSLFSDDDEDDLFSSVKPKAPPPKVSEKPSKPVEKAPLASPEPSSESQKPAPALVKPKDPSSRIGKLKASLVINPSALLPGATPSLPSSGSGLGNSSSSGVSSSSLSPSPVTTPLELPRDPDTAAVNFDTPAHITMLQSAHKSRVKGSSLRRPQSRAARQQSAHRSVEGASDDHLKTAPKPSVPDLGPPPPEKPVPAPVKPSPLPTEASSRPSGLKLPVSTNNTDSSKENHKSKKVLPVPDEEDLFSSDHLFGSSIASPKPASSADLKNESSPASNNTQAQKEKSTLPSIFDAGTDDLFQKVKSKPSTKKTKPAPFLEDENDDDLFGVGNSSTPSSTNSRDLKSSNSVPKQDIFQDEVVPEPKAQKKHKEKKFDATLFDDNVDIFADLSDTFKPKHKSKTKGEAKSIFDDDMDDIFSTRTVKPVAKAPPKLKKAPPEPSAASDTVDIFDDPLNALGGN
ncbi:WASH complex subunit 2 isoform X2 [Eucyclogobius newberryi]|uniref:WASH complex subunit 2 isoform X2 n=1 Tax=Eucyclogobius newberryi TaxID=166745 RepID=UPI003B5CDA1E